MAGPQIYDLIPPFLHPLPKPHQQSCWNGTQSVPQGPPRNCPHLYLAQSCQDSLLWCSAGPRFPILGTFTGGTHSGWKSF